MTSTTEVLPVVARADDVPGPPQGRWTYEAYARIPDDGRRYEIIDGVLYVTPAPSYPHQNSVSNFHYHLKTHLRTTGRGIVILAPFDVELMPGQPVVQPDVLVVLAEHRHRLTNSRLIGPPDLVIEVSSPSTATHDRSRKLSAYARAGVPEYWIADPNARTVELLFLEGSEYVSAGVFSGAAVLPSRIVPGLGVPVEEFFAE
ncbi:MAG TPA: Uma2 family endonuclease [Dehalococcoidia bacterium]|nr:Uma2 family endonuclease [Dehalococcoidia bacterium]